MFNWTHERIEELKTLVAQNLSGKQIGHHFGITRNAVCGKCDRLGIKLNSFRRFGLPNADRPKKVSVNGVRVFQPRSRSFTPKVAPMPVEPLNIPLVDLEPHHCREVVSQDSFMGMFCGHDKKDGSSYCPFHSAQNEYRAEPRKPNVSHGGRFAA